MSSLKSTLIHTLELAVVLGIAYAAQRLFSVSNEAIMALVIVVLGAAAKLIRSDAGPVQDYVNKS